MVVNGLWTKLRNIWKTFNIINLIMIYNCLDDLIFQFSFLVMLYNFIFEGTKFLQFISKVCTFIHRELGMTLQCMLIISTKHI